MSEIIDCNKCDYISLCTMYLCYYDKDLEDEEVEL